ncbi:MAG: VOC family protein [Acidimicrobiales bacterium]|nr:VOC family protein [Acidimicrobiales bacterium]
MSFNPYVFFSGNCAEAFAFYSKVFGVEPHVLTNAEVPPGTELMPGSEPHHVMHAAIDIGGSLLMGSDDPTGDGGAKTGVAVVFTAADADEVKRIVSELAEGGELQMPVEETFWSPAFGALVDRFGVPWMIDCPALEVDASDDSV